MPPPFDQYPYAEFFYNSNRTRAMQPIYQDASFFGTAIIWVVFGLFYYWLDQLFEDILNNLDTVLEQNSIIIPANEQSMIFDAVTAALIDNLDSDRNPPEIADSSLEQEEKEAALVMAEGVAACFYFYAKSVKNQR